jgi:hypothetical protein
MDYRCYQTDAQGHILAVEVFQVSSDSEACERARLIVMNLQWSTHELWHLSRKVICQMQTDAGARVLI